jgi:hypothetical protein
MRSFARVVMIAKRGPAALACLWLFSKCALFSKSLWLCYNPVREGRDGELVWDCEAVEEGT